MNALKSIAARLPSGWQRTLKRGLYARQIRRGTFRTDEPEYARLAEWIRPGDWVLDIGANVGHYTKRFSELAGAGGRVIAFEPGPATFSLLAANCLLFAHPNVTLFNAAASDITALAGLATPTFDSGLDNGYEASLTPDPAGALPVLTLAIDSLDLQPRVALVKIDAEGHEARVLTGMERTLARHRPVLIVETGDPDLVSRVSGWGYAPEQLPGSPNYLFRPDP
ncbi:MAG: FkbM family methyltransferase [Lentisphaerae bacterium]|nr:FkbM family methyltransferase [Lentisphaerota bacterium]